MGIRRWLLLLPLVVTLVLSMTAFASAEGSKTVAGAPVIPFGQQQFGNLNNGAVTHNSCESDVYTEWWTLNVSAGDHVRIDWEAQQLEYTALLVYPPGTTDYTYPNTNPILKQELNSNNKNEAIVEATADGSLPVAFTSSDWSCLSGTPGPYDFTASLQHALAVALKPYTHIRTNTLVSASVRLANGAPAPDGLAFNLTVSWGNNESATYAATSSGGGVSFPMALPEAAKGQTASLVVSRPEDSQFLAAESGKVVAKVGRGQEVVPVPSRCELAMQHARTLARQHRRMQLHARHARGANKRRLRHRARVVGRKLRAARAHAAAICSAA